MASSKHADWRAFSAWVTTLDEKQALKALKAEAAKTARPYVMRRFYHRWRAVSARSDLASIALGKLPGYLK